MGIYACIPLKPVNLKRGDRVSTAAALCCISLSRGTNLSAPKKKLNLSRINRFAFANENFGGKKTEFIFQDYLTPGYEDE